MSHVTFTNRKSIGNVVGQLKNRRQKPPMVCDCQRKRFLNNGRKLHINSAHQPRESNIESDINCGQNGSNQDNRVANMLAALEIGRENGRGVCVKFTKNED